MEASKVPSGAGAKLSSLSSSSIISGRDADGTASFPAPELPPVIISIRVMKKLLFLN